MKITFREISVECTQAEKADALEVLRELFALAPSVSPVSSAPSARIVAPSAPCDALRELLRGKGIGFKFRPDGKDKGETLESALSKACKLAGVTDAEIESAMASAPLGDALDGLTVPDATSEDDGSELV